jgi:Leucine-rich repeat (LRR) protein
MQKNVLIILLLCFSLFCQISTKLNAQVQTQDSLALVTLYDSTNGATWSNSTNWLSAEPVDNWYGVTVFGDRVSEVSLSNNNLTDSIPTEIGNLTGLTYLSLRNNNLAGTIPDTIGNLSNLTYLSLQGNDLSGTIPFTIGNLTNLTELHLAGNNLSGTIPEAIGNLINLTYLALLSNDLTGSIPDTIGNLINLTHLYLSHNSLAGTIPDVIYDLTNLVLLSLGYNYLIGGSLSSRIGNLTNLEYLQLESMSLEGPIPNEICNLIDLTQIGLGNNQNISGTIPANISNLANLEVLSLYNNSLVRSLPDSIGNLINLERLVLANNSLTGTIPEGIGNLVNLTEFQIQRNQFTGVIPDTIANLVNLTYFPLYDNDFYDLPDLSSLISLNSLHIYNNRFTFEDIEPNIGVPLSLFEYSPQDSVGIQKDTTLNIGDNLDMSVVVGGTANQYQWVKDGVDITNATDSIYIIASASVSDSGIYICRITNTIATDLTIYSRPVHVNVIDPTGFHENSSVVPHKYALYQNYPNPFNPTTVIKFDLPEASKVKIEILNVLGQTVATILDSKISAGQHQVNIDATYFPSGIYFYTIIAESHGQTDKFAKVKKMVLVR